MGNMSKINSTCKSFGKKVASFKKCEECKTKEKEACQEIFKSSLVAKNEKAAAAKTAGTVNVNKENKKGEDVMKNQNTTNGTAKIGKAQEIKNMIFSLARKAMYTRKELGQAMRNAFPEYKNSTLSTYISDSFNVKYAGATGCGIHRMLAYVQTGKKKIIVVR